MIKHYAKSCDQFHSGIEEGIIAGEANYVAATLYKDLTQLDNILPCDGSAEQLQTRDGHRTTIQETISNLFEWSEGREERTSHNSGD
jgi:hypothetical protein